MGGYCDSGFKWSVAADVESLAWDPHMEHSFAVSLEDGTVTGFDTRTASSDLSIQPKPSFTLHGHDKAVCTVAYNSSVPNLLATGSTDKMVKLWDLSNHSSCISSKNPKAGAVFSISFSEDCPFRIAIGENCRYGICYLKPRLPEDTDSMPIKLKENSQPWIC